MKRRVDMSAKVRAQPHRPDIHRGTGGALPRQLVVELRVAGPGHQPRLERQADVDDFHGFAFEWLLDLRGNDVEFDIGRAPRSARRAAGNVFGAASATDRSIILCCGLAPGWEPRPKL